MSNKRLTDPIRCIDCGSTNAYERCIDKVWDIYCPDCGAVFGWDNLPTACRSCGSKLRLHHLAEFARGLCVKCHLATYSPEKKAAMNRLIGLAFRKTPATEAEKDAAIDEAFKHLDK